MWTLRGKRAALFASIPAHRDEKSVCIKVKPGRQLFLRLLEQTRVREVVMGAGILRTVPARVRAALEGAGVKITAQESRVGRPAKFEAQKRKKAQEMLRQKKTAREISAALGVPVTAVYWWKRKGSGKGRRKTGGQAQ